LNPTAENLRVLEYAYSKTLTSKKEKLDFVKPEYEIERIDSYEIRQKILNIFYIFNIFYIYWKKLGFSKGTLHYISYVGWKKLGFSEGTLHYISRTRRLISHLFLTAMFWKGE